MARERGRLGEFLGLAQLLIERGHDRGHRELEDGGVGSHETADINGRGEGIVIALLEGAEMVAADFVISANWVP